MATDFDEKKQEKRLETLFDLIKELSETEQIELIQQIEENNQQLRKSDRKSFRSEVTYASDKGAYSEFISDISTTGLFIETQVPVIVGKKVILTFPLNCASKHLKLSGEIVRKASNGIGIKFHPLNKQTQT
jgi:Tfp pilus assembly protein PilZ